jgi:hypothetical protein
LVVRSGGLPLDYCVLQYCGSSRLILSILWQHLLVVVPIVGILLDIQAFKPVLNVDEVDDIFDVPLEMFLKVCAFSMLSKGLHKISVKACVIYL